MQSDFNSLVEQIVEEWSIAGAAKTGGNLLGKSLNLAARTTALAAGIPNNPFKGLASQSKTSAGPTSSKPNTIENSVNYSTVAKLQHTPIQAFNNFSQAETEQIKSKVLEIVDLVKTKNLQKSQLLQMIKSVLG